MRVYSISPLKFELDWSTNNGVLISDRNHWKHKTHTDTQTETDTLPIYHIESSNYSFSLLTLLYNFFFSGKE